MKKKFQTAFILVKLLKIYEYFEKIKFVFTNKINITSNVPSMRKSSNIIYGRNLRAFLFIVTNAKAKGYLIFLKLEVVKKAGILLKRTFLL